MQYRATYRSAVLWIARNDNEGSEERLTESVVETYLTVALVADLFKSTPAEVAKDVVLARKMFV